ncbi:hypothetical protein ACFRFQ_01580 [Rhodococcus sp. NPDC056743]|uniref:hypothetical protein n=1 Tax=Rhodococcus sp. NPDC056743 TaxID=3345934 RepID=UPI00366ED6DF
MLSTHLLTEVANPFGHVIVVERGRIVVDEDADTLLNRAVVAIGSFAAIDAFAASGTVRRSAATLASWCRPTRSARNVESRYSQEDSVCSRRDLGTDGRRHVGGHGEQVGHRGQELPGTLESHRRVRHTHCSNDLEPMDRRFEDHHIQEGTERDRLQDRVRNHGDAAEPGESFDIETLNYCFSIDVGLDLSGNFCELTVPLPCTDLDDPTGLGS